MTSTRRRRSRRRSRDQPRQHPARQRRPSSTTAAAPVAAGATVRTQRRRHRPATACSTPARPGCSRASRASGHPGFARDPAAQNVVNTATATGTDPDRHDGHRRRGRRRRRLQPGDLARPSSSTAVTAGHDPVRPRRSRYTYAVTNDGNTPLQQRHPRRRHPTVRRPDARTGRTGNGDAVLDVGETWTYSCTCRADRSGDQHGRP